MTRNFWVQGRIDGRQTEITGGPARKDGGMVLDIWQRVDGERLCIASIECRAHGDDLVTYFGVADDQGGPQKAIQFRSKR